MNSVQKRIRLTSEARAIEGTVADNAIVEGTVFKDKAAEAINAKETTGPYFISVADNSFDNAYAHNDATVVQASNLAPTEPCPSNKNTIN